MIEITEIQWKEIDAECPYSGNEVGFVWIASSSNAPCEKLTLCSDISIFITKEELVHLCKAEDKAGVQF